MPGGVDPGFWKQWSNDKDYDADRFREALAVRDIHPPSQIAKRRSNLHFLIGKRLFELNISGAIHTRDDQCTQT